MRAIFVESAKWTPEEVGYVRDQIASRFRLVVWGASVDDVPSLQKLFGTDDILVVTATVKPDEIFHMQKDFDIQLRQSKYLGKSDAFVGLMRTADVGQSTSSFMAVK